METIHIYADRIFTFIELAWRYGGWWALGGAVSFFVLLGFGIHRSPY